MGVRSRTIALVTAAAVVLWVAVGLAASVYAARSSTTADAAAALEGLDTCEAVLATETKRLITLCGDWAAWDDSYAFVAHPTRDYIDNNLTDDALSNLEVDFMIFVDASGRTVHSKAIDPTTRRTGSVPDGVVEYLATQPPLLHMTDPRKVVSGALSLPEGPFLIAAQPIGSSVFDAKPNGTLVVGLLVDTHVLSTIQGITRRPTSIYSSASSTLPADAASAVARLSEPGAPDILTTGADSVVTYRMIPDIDGRPGLVLRVTSPRSAFVESRTGILGWGLAMSVFAFGVITVLGITLDRTVLRRVVGLSSAVSEIERSTDTHTRVPVSGRDEIGELAGGINRMLDELGRSHAEMAYLADHDSLTGLHNRRYFERALRREFDEHRRLGMQGAVLWFDLDSFKVINDTLGHSVGDELLAEFGRHLKSETRAYCTAARLGGDEFGMLIPHVGGPDALAAAARLIAGISSRTFRAGGRDLHLSASAGVALYPDHGETTGELLAHADIAMYAAKAEGGDRVVAYDAGIGPIA